MGGVEGGRRRFGVNLQKASGVGRRPPDVVGRWLLLLVALGGLLAMHGLSDHGIGGPAAVAASGTRAVASGMPDMADGSPGGDRHSLAHAAAHPGTRSAGDVGVEASDPGPGENGAGGSGGGHGDHHGGLAVGTCLAVLVAALLLRPAVWLTGLLIRLRHAPVERAAEAAATAFRARARGPAPPDLRLLSIQRC